MKKAVKVIIPLLLAVGLGIFSVWNYIDGYVVDSSHLKMKFGEVPTGTVFADILVKEDWHRYPDGAVNVSFAPTLELDENCELAKYNEDGYASMILRTGLALLEDHELSPEVSDKHSCLGMMSGDDDIFDHIHHIKVAYCDKDGNILGITDEAEVKSAVFGMPEYTIKADGSKVKLDTHIKLPFFWGVVLPAILGGILFIAAIIIAVKKSKKAKTSKSEE